MVMRPPPQFTYFLTAPYSRLSERKSELRGTSIAPMRLNDKLTVIEGRPPVNSTEKIRSLIERVCAEHPARPPEAEDLSH